MTQDEIIEMAIQAGFDEHHAKFDTRMEAFAKLVRNHYSYTHAHLWLTRIEGAVKAEREACAKAIDEMHLYGFSDVREFEIATLQDAAKAIRARAQADRGEA